MLTRSKRRKASDECILEWAVVRESGEGDGGEIAKEEERRRRKRRVW
jgi:hypothetical protein